MRAIEFIIEGYREALAEFGREASPDEVRTVIDQYKQLVNKNQFRDPREKNIDYWRPKGWTAFSQMVKLKSSDITNSQLKRGKTVGNTIILQDDAEWTVIIPLDKETSVHYGKGTEWCTTKPYQSNFENYFYRDKITLIYAIPKNKESGKHVAISIDPDGKVQMFNRADDPINAQQYTQISSLDPNEFIAIANKSANQQQMESQREKYDQALADTNQLLQETPLNVDAIERALKFTKNPEDCYNYIIAYGQEHSTQITVHESILIAAADHINKLPLATQIPKSLASQLGQYIDFNKISSTTFTSILRSSPSLFLYNLDKLSTERRAKLISSPKAACDYAVHILKGKPFPEGEAAIAKSGEESMRYASILDKPFPLGEPAIAKDAYNSLDYAIDILKKKPFPIGEPAIAKSAQRSLEYAEMLGKPFPLGEKVIATNREYAKQYDELFGTNLSQQ